MSFPSLPLESLLFPGSIGSVHLERTAACALRGLGPRRLAIREPTALFSED
jgi:hypothetical protein